MVVCTLVPLIVPLLLLSGLTGVHPVRGPVGGVVETVVSSTGSAGSSPYYARL